MGDLSGKKKKATTVTGPTQTTTVKRQSLGQHRQIQQTVTGPTQTTTVKRQPLGQHRQIQQTVTGPTQATKETVTRATQTNSTARHWAHTGH
jgi:hypothetical protein